VRPSDFEDIVETYFSFFPEAEADPAFGLSLFRERPSLEDERKWFSGVLREIAEGDQVKLVVEIGSHVVGSCDVRRVVPRSPLDHRGVFGICVRKDFRGRGVGTALAKATIEKCKGKFEALELTVNSKNRMAIKLYKGLGFKRYGTLPGALKRAGRYFDYELMYLKL